MKRIKKALIVFSVLFTVGFGLFTVLAFTSDDFKVSKSLDVFFTLFRELDIFYVDNIDPEKLVNTGIEAMLMSLDPYTEYYSEEDKGDFEFLTTGKYGGIGAMIQKRGVMARIMDVYEGTPSQIGGISVGDYITKIDGVSVNNFTNEQISMRLKGEPGSKVTLELKDSFTDSLYSKTLIRQRIAIPSVPYSGVIEKEIGYVRLSSFTLGCADDLRKSILDLKGQGAKKIILDLRGNPGGLMDEAVKIVNFFVPKNQLVVYTQGKTKQFDSRYFTNEQPLDTIIPLVVLVNSGSASASEIVAGSLQDLDRAVIVGSRTFGKGLVQTTRKLSYGGQLKVTTAKYYIPSGRCIQAIDYSHRNEDGSVGHIPDSLIKAFKTKAGRVVYDGGGILPDITLKADTLSNICMKAYAENRFFEFANVYHRSHKSIANPDTFVVDETVLNGFITYLNENGFVFKSEEERLIDRLDSLVSKKSEGKNLSLNIEAIRSQVSRGIAKQIIENKDDFNYFLTEEIVGRYYFQRGSFQAAMKFDTQLYRSKQIINDISQYKKMLGR
ncbi:S41 family peptidase [Williamwhitmania taraxaci]|uniref:C-terminal processing peptidase-3. Serine peptidase. MEROPS family S41A n=1 Tax=Williamwhitmania taraxaci TaxID=1640674 RepID=A0A1G6GY33_9BACT|nr:S41 family peptidase [Williamwhitmania taraxaci]SDB86899.1 C-terminal processing peptidase-3. Serine peptidase. MEROPS family S41A [Williamwhitmania taraxaci]